MSASLAALAVIRSSSANSSSRHPRDWGRALALAAADLARQAELDGTEDLLGQELTLHFSGLGTGAQITMTWTQSPER